MAIDFHEDARVNFNARGEALLPIVAPVPIGDRPVPVIHNAPIATTVSLTDPNVTAWLRARDWTGNPRAAAFFHEGRALGFSGGTYTQFRQLVEGMVKTRGLREIASVEYLETEVLEWVKARHLGQHSIDLTTTMLPRIEAAVADYEVWVPTGISLGDIEVPVGRVILKPMPSEFLDRWIDNVIASVKYAPPDKRAKTFFVFSERTDRLQGHTIATIALRAEPIKAREMAVAHAEEALALLRFLSPINHEPTAISFCAVLGKERQESSESFLIKEGGWQYSAADVRHPRPEFQAHTLNSAPSRATLAKMTSLLTRAHRTQFQESVLNALFLYTRNALTADLSDKLTYILAALESVFLKDKSEPIQQNLGDRLAFSVSTDGDERLRIVDMIRDIYARRSDFLHHGEVVGLDDIDAMRAFMKVAWFAMGTLLVKLDGFQNVQDFTTALDRMKYHGTSA